MTKEEFIGLAKEYLDQPMNVCIKDDWVLSKEIMEEFDLKERVNFFLHNRARMLMVSINEEDYPAMVDELLNYVLEEA